MAFNSGKDGSVSASPGIISKVTEWTCEMDAEEVNITGLGNATREYLAGVKGWRGTYTTNIDDSAAAITAGTAVGTGSSLGLGVAAATITMKWSASIGVTGTCVVTGINTGATVEAGPNQLVYNYVGSGTLTLL